MSCLLSSTGAFLINIPQGGDLILLLQAKKWVHCKNNFIFEMMYHSALMQNSSLWSIP